MADGTWTVHLDNEIPWVRTYEVVGERPRLTLTETLLAVDHEDGRRELIPLAAIQYMEFKPA